MPIPARERGDSLVEIILVIVLLGIAIPPVLHIFSYNVSNSVDSEQYTKAVFFAEEKMEEILAAKREYQGSGYNNMIYHYLGQTEDVPEEGYTRTVRVDTTGKSWNGIPYAEIRVVVHSPQIDSVALTAWVTDYGQ